MKRYLLFSLLCIIFFTDLAHGGPNRPESGNGKEVMVIGLIPEQNIFRQMERYTPLCEYLSRKIGLQIKLKVLTRYGNIIDNFVSEGLDGAFFGSFTYALAHKNINVGVIARPVDLHGSSTYHGLMLVRKDSGIQGIEDMKGTRFAFVDKATTAGFLMPLAYFREHGIIDYKDYLKEVYFTGTHEDAIYDVLNNRADIGAAKNTVFERLAETDARLNRELKILAKSPDVPENGLALRKNILPCIRKAIKEALLNMHKDPEGQAALKALESRKFIVTTDKDYRPVHRYARKADLDLSTYNYRND